MDWIERYGSKDTVLVWPTTHYLLVGGGRVAHGVHAVQRAQGDDLAELGAELINGSPPPIDYATCTGW